MAERRKLAKTPPARKARKVTKPKAATRKAPTRAKRKASRKAAKRKPRARAKPADPRALTAAQAARLLQVPVESIRGHLAAGAPADTDGRINLVAYAAWLCRQRAAPVEATS